MKFLYAIGNPPYQDSNSNKKFYPAFYIESKKISDNVCLIFPTAWQEPKKLQGLGQMNTPEIKQDKQIIAIKNLEGVFPGVAGAEWTNIILWKKNYDNKLNGKQRLYINDKEEIVELLTNYNTNNKPDELIELYEYITNKPFVPLNTITSGRSTYGFATDVIDNENKYNLPKMFESKQNESNYRLIGKDKIKYLNNDYPIPKLTDAFNYYKVLLPVVWGNLSEKYLGGAYSNIYICKPKDCCTGTFIESGKFTDLETTIKHSKYLMSKFCRALLFINKFSISLSENVWKTVPLQDYSESWWNKSIEEIDEHLFDKYNIPENIRQFIRDNIQPRTEENIINYCNK